MLVIKIIEVEEVVAANGLATWGVCVGTCGGLSCNLNTE
jgi:hypothetical protein